MQKNILVSFNDLSNSILSTGIFFFSILLPVGTSAFYIDGVPAYRVVDPAGFEPDPDTTLDIERLVRFQRGLNQNGQTGPGNDFLFKIDPDRTKTCRSDRIRNPACIYSINLRLYRGIFCAQVMHFA